MYIYRYIILYFIIYKDFKLKLKSFFSPKFPGKSKNNIKQLFLIEKYLIQIIVIKRYILQTIVNEINKSFQISCISSMLTSTAPIINVVGFIQLIMLSIDKVIN